MRNKGLASEYGDVAVPMVLRAWGVARVWPAEALPATNGSLWRLSTEHREIDDQHASAAWTGLPPMAFNFLNIGGFPRPDFLFACPASYC